MTKRELIRALDALNVSDSTHVDLEIEVYQNDDTDTYLAALGSVSVDLRFKTPVIKLLSVLP